MKYHVMKRTLLILIIVLTGVSGWAQENEFRVLHFVYLTFFVIKIMSYKKFKIKLYLCEIFESKTLKNDTKYVF